MTIYILRDKEGVSKATLPATVALDIFEREGEWKRVRYERGKRSLFIVGVDTAFVASRGGEALTIYVWKGDKVVID